MLGKTSSATYRLKVHCARLELLADLLGAITAQKNTTLQSIAWGYPDDHAVRGQWLDDCIRRANEKARRVAAGLGVELMGVHSFEETYADPESERPIRFEFEMAAPMARQRKQISSEDLGLEVSHSKEVVLSIEVEYRVSGFTRADPEKVVAAS